MIFIVPIIAIFLVVWAVDVIYYQPTPTQIKLEDEKSKEKNLTNKDISAQKYFEKYIEK